MGNPVVHFEVIGKDGPALQKFYAELFGWHIQNMPEMLNYGVVDTHAGGGINGGVGQEPEGGTLVTFYAAVPDLQATLDKAESLGGKIAMPVMDIPGVVTLAQFLDPQGNRIGIIKDDPSVEGPGVSSGSNPAVTWFEVLGTDAKALQSFYSELFGWDITVAPDATIEYGHLGPQDGKGIGGGIGASPTGQPMVTVYAQVDDLDKYLERAESLGAKTVMKPLDMDNISYAQFADPEGNVFGLFNDRS